MRTCYISFCILLFTISLSAQSTSLFDLYEIPTYSYNRLNISGQDFLSYSKSNNLDQHTSDENIYANFILNDKYVNQSLMSTNTVTSYVQLYYYKTEYENPGNNYWSEGSEANIQVKSFNNWYVNNPKGLFVFADPGIYYVYNFREEYNRNSIKVQAGAGYGRVTGVKSIVQAYIIADELNLSLNDETLVKIADLLDKYYDGVYYARYRDDENIEFYKDLAELTGRPDDAFRVQQILSSGLYKTTERYSGWELKLGTTAWYMKTIQEYYYPNEFPDNSVSTDLFASVEYALPVSFITQINTSLSCSKNLDQKIYRVPSLSATAGISFMHNYNWMTELSVNYQRVFPNEEAWPETERLDDRDKLEVTAKSEVAIINSFSIYGYLTYSNSDFSNNPVFNGLNSSASKYEGINFHLGFNYYIM